MDHFNIIYIYIYIIYNLYDSRIKVNKKVSENTVVIDGPSVYLATFTTHSCPVFNHSLISCNDHTLMNYNSISF